MAVPLRELTSREPAELPVDTPVTITIRAVVVQHPRTGQELELEGPVDFSTWDSCAFELTDPATRESKMVPGLCLVLSGVDPPQVGHRLNVVAKRLITLLTPYLESGEYRRLRFTITKRGERPRSTFTVEPRPV